MDDRVVYFEDVNVGDELPPLVNEITTVSMVMYAAATWDYMRYHYDYEYVRQRGFQAPFVDGQMLGAFLAQLVTDWMGPQGDLKKLAFRFRQLVFPGDTITCKGKVSSKSMDGSQAQVECELWIENQKGETVLAPASATVVLPSKAS